MKTANGFKAPPLVRIITYAFIFKIGSSELNTLAPEFLLLIKDLVEAIFAHFLITFTTSTAGSVMWKRCARSCCFSVGNKNVARR
jgi:hypothetical protein